MKLIVGLGNPGKKYELTRHNIGFIVLDSLSKELEISLKQHKFDGDFEKLKYKGQDVILLKPQTFMNLSGDCVVSFMNYFKIKAEDVLLIHDEIDLPFGRIQFKNKGSAAGHNGLKDIIEKTQAKNLMRLRIGVGRNDRMNAADWVLSNFEYQELLLINSNEKLFVEAVLTWLKDDNIIHLMNKFNNQQF